MFDRLKFSASALSGLALGIVLALPLFWVGVKSSVGSLHKNVVATFERVVVRQQNMSDEALRLEMQYKSHKVKFSRADFAKVELLRSRLAGEGDFDGRIELSQQLERALLNVQTSYIQTLKSNSRAAGSAYIRGFGHNWGPMMRYLVDEQYRFSNAVKGYNRVLRTRPVPYVIGHKSFGALISSFAKEVRISTGLYIKQGIAWVKFAGQWLWAAVTFNDNKPHVPAPMPHEPFAADALYSPLPEPLYIAQAPVPEEDYPELQYDQQAPNMADVEVGQQDAVLDSTAVEPFAKPVPTVQKTAVYK